MGLLGSLFGKKDRQEKSADRCNECGMVGGRHTDWCPMAAEAAATPGDAGTRAGTTPRGGPD